MIEKFGSVEVLVAPAAVSGAFPDDKGSRRVKRSAGSLKKVVAGLATGLGEEVLAIKQAHRPDKIQVDISLSFSEKFGWVIGLEGTQTFSVGLTWNRPAPVGVAGVKPARMRR